MTWSPVLSLICPFPTSWAWLQMTVCPNISQVCVCVASILFDGAGLIPTRKYQTCLIFAFQCQAATDGSPAAADEKEQTGKCLRMDVAYFYICGFYGADTVISAESPPNSLCPSSRTASWRCWLSFIFAFLPLRLPVAQRFDSAQSSLCRTGSRSRKQNKAYGWLSK